ncbi:Hypothetical protein FKW44_021106 [Caligus rogercresseyi]|uniref:Uncharacterized protein n=1 Tax=Caligus rogercresseyi TaxID=217165 RepID=A0A7T8JV27_CALRO|nr:Hypothetical protein FKW44_021106 [Caligus rogercresseyi]
MTWPTLLQLTTTDYQERSSIFDGPLEGSQVLGVLFHLVILGCAETCWNLPRLFDDSRNGA